MLHYRDGYTIKETADMLKMNERTVKYKSKEFIAALKKILESENKEATSFTVVKNVSSCVAYIILIVESRIYTQKIGGKTFEALPPTGKSNQT